MPPRTLGRYEVLSMIGRGGVGTVYRARNRDTGEHVAVKLLAPPPACDPGAARRLAREFEALHGLHHPNVIRVYEAGVHEGYSFLAMELVEGLDLRSYLSPALDDAGDPGPRPPLSRGELGELDAWSAEPQTESLVSSTDLGASGEHPWESGGPASGGPEAIRAFAELMDEPETDPGSETAPGEGGAEARSTPAVAQVRPVSPALLERLNGPNRVSRLRDAMVQVCDALAYVHGRGLVHRDLKPSNIMVDDLRRVRIMDFGLVKLASDAAPPAHHGKIVGTYLYMAPEQALGEPVDHRADLYSLGVILFELVCGRPPFVARGPAELRQVTASCPAPLAVAVNPGVDVQLGLIAERLLARRPQERFQSASEVAAALRQT